MAQNQKNIQPKVSEINIREELEKYLRYWPWFLLCVLISLIAGYLYLQQTSRVYTAGASIIIKDGRNAQSSEMSAFQDLGMFNGMNSNSIENEMGILKSRRLMKEVVNALDLHITYHDPEALRNSELYTASPYTAKILSLKENQIEGSHEYRLIKTQGNTFELIRLTDEKVFKAISGEPVDLGFALIMLTENENALEAEGKYPEGIILKFNSRIGLAKSYSNSLNVKLKDYNSSLLELSLNDEVKKKAEDILDQLILEYNRETIEDKNLVATNTARFIDERLSLINEELDSVEIGKVEFKEDNRLTDIQSDSQMFVESAKEYRADQEKVETQIELVNAILSYITDENSSDLLPANLGIEEANVNSQISKYNEIVLERNRILAGSSELNPVVKKLNTQLEQLENNIIQSLSQLRRNLKITKGNLDKQMASIGSRISSVPLQEKQFRGIERQQQIKETLYLFLLQKREENSLSLAVTAPKAKIVDNALSSAIPISPNTRSIYLTALLIGLGLPFAVIYLRQLLNNKIDSKEDILAEGVDTPILGEVPRLSKSQPELIQNNDRSVLAESFRLLHANLQYFLGETVGLENQQGKCLFVTSTIKGEGKTFTAFNLAITLANTGKKVIIVGCDLRNPQLQRFEPGAKNWLGVSNYLVDPNLHLKELVKTSSVHKDLDVLTSGSIPPNPAELLRSKRLEDLFEKLKNEYDYVIVDTAPAMVVADTFLINKHADLTLYTVRANYTEKRLLNFINDARNEDKLKNVTLVLNSVKAAHYGYGKYGYSYGYAYGVDEESKWKKLKSAFNIF